VTRRNSIRKQGTPEEVDKKKRSKNLNVYSQQGGGVMSA